MKNFVDLKNYLTKEIKPQENYQYFIFRELINSGGQISYDELANRYDVEFENTYKTDTKTIFRDTPTKVLTKHGYITSDKNNIYANYNEEPLYYKETISWILQKCLDHWVKNKSIKGLEFKEGIIKTDKEIEKFCYENNTPRELVENIILSINRGEKQIILDGPPGTGKTYLIKKIIKFLSNGDSISDLVQFHPSYGYEEFVEGLRPVSTDAGLEFAVIPGRLLDLLSRTKNVHFPISKIEKEKLEKTIELNQKFNRDKLVESFSNNENNYELTINDFEEVFNLQKKYSATKTPEMDRREKIIRYELPEKIENWLNDSGFNHYKVIGKSVLGKYSTVPWVRIYRKEFSPNASTGYYVVLLFDALGESVYLSLNRGSLKPGTADPISDEEAENSVKKIREIIKPYTDLILDKLSEDTESFNAVWEIDLKSKVRTPKAYEKTHIFGFEITQKNGKISYNWDFIDALELLEVVYQNLDILENENKNSSILDSFSMPETLTELNINELPESPGVHLIYYEDTLLYVGETGNTRRRITEHMRSHHASGDTFINHSQKKFGLDLSKDEDKNKFDQLRSNMTIIYKLTEEKETLKNTLIDELKPEFNQKLASEKSIDKNKFNKWTKIVYQALENLGGSGYLSQIYKEVDKLISDKPKTWEAQVRASLERSSSDSEAFEGKHDLFILKEKGSGNWEIKDFNMQGYEEYNKEQSFSLENYGNYNFLIIDEINRGNLPKIFGELLNTFEYRDENISLQYSDKPLSVPSNLIFLGTMNSTDKSVGRMDAALRRRFDFIHVEPNYEVLEKYYESRELLVPNLIEGLEILNELLEKDLGKHCLIGHTFFMKNHDSPFTYDDIKKVWDRKIYPLLEEYFLDDSTKLEKYKTYTNFWEEVEPVESNKKSNNRYSKELLSKHLLEISNEHKELQLAIEKWGKDIKNMNIWPGYINTNFRSGGRTLIYTANSNGLSERDGKYHLFKLAGNGNIVLPLHTLYSNDYNRAPFNSREFREVFEKKLIDYFQKFNLKINAEKFFSKSKPSFEMQEIIKTKSIEDFLDIWDWVIEEINNTGNKYE